MSWKSFSGITALSVGMLMLLASIFASLPSNTLSDTGIRSAARYFSVDLAPQGWAFFTRDPSEADLLYYRAESLEPLWVTPQGRLENAFGVSRTQRAQGPEAAALLTEVSEDQWHECGRGMSLAECAAEAEAGAPAPLQVANNAPIQTLCGDILMTQSEPVPWSYRNLYETTHITKYVSYLEVDCA
jgi:antimicrobial peptide system SdpA family protein